MKHDERQIDTLQASIQSGYLKSMLRCHPEAASIIEDLIEDWKELVRHKHLIDKLGIEAREVELPPRDGYRQFGYEYHVPNWSTD